MPFRLDVLHSPLVAKETEQKKKRPATARTIADARVSLSAVRPDGPRRPRAATRRSARTAAPASTLASAARAAGELGYGSAPHAAHSPSSSASTASGSTPPGCGTSIAPQDAAARTREEEEEEERDRECSGGMEEIVAAKEARTTQRRGTEAVVNEGPTHLHHSPTSSM